MKVYYADKELNEKYGNMFREKVKVNRCYDNTLEYLYEMLRYEKDLKVFFGWVQVFRGQDLYVRHACYLVGDRILDLTLMKKGDFSNIADCEYVPIKIMTPEEYGEMIEIEATKHSGRSDLMGVLRKIELPLMKEMMNQGKSTLG